MKIYRTFFCIAILFLIIFSGCAINSIKDTVKSESDEDVLRERIMTYCNYRISGEWEKSYRYEDPLYRKTTALYRYIRRFSGGAVKWLNAEIKNMKIEDDKAVVDLKVRVKTVLMMPLGVSLRVPPKVIERDSEIRHLWVKADGVWYHAFKPKGLSKYN